MPYALMIKWVLGGGWKWILEAIALAALVIWGAAWLHNYHSIQAKAAMADRLQGRLSDEHARLDAAVAARDAAEKDRGVARAELARFDADRNTFYDALRRGMKNAAIATNPICLPSDADRSVRNGVVQRFIPNFGKAGDGSAVPATP